MRQHQPPRLSSVISQAEVSTPNQRTPSIGICLLAIICCAAGQRQPADVKVNWRRTGVSGGRCCRPFGGATLLLLPAPLAPTILALLFVIELNSDPHLLLLSAAAGNAESAIW